MELVYVTVIAAVIGGIARYLLPGRRAYGALLLPAAAAAVTSTVWAGWKFDGGWIWAVALGAGTLTAVLIPLLLPRYRDAQDTRMMHELSARRS